MFHVKRRTRRPKSRPVPSWQGAPSRTGSAITYARRSEHRATSRAPRAKDHSGCRLARARWPDERDIGPSRRATSVALGPTRARGAGQSTGRHAGIGGALPRDRRPKALLTRVRASQWPAITPMIYMTGDGRPDGVGDHFRTSPPGARKPSTTGRLGHVRGPGQVIAVSLSIPEPQGRHVAAWRAGPSQRSGDRRCRLVEGKIS